MSQDTALLVAYSVARQIIPNGVSISTAAGTPSTCQKRTQSVSCINDGRPGSQQHLDMPFCSVNTNDDEQQYPHFFAWLNAHKRAPTSRSQSQNQQRAASTSSSARSSQHCITNDHSSKPASATRHSSSRPASATSKRPASATKERMQASRMCSLSAVPERGLAKHPSRPSSGVIARSMRQQPTLQQRPCSGSLMHQRPSSTSQPATAGIINSSNRPLSAGLALNCSTSPGRPHTAGWLADRQQQQQQQQQGRPAKAVPSWMQGLKDHTAPQLTACVQAQAQAAQSTLTAQQHGDCSAQANNHAGSGAADGDNSSSSSNPWAAFGLNAPAAWQQLGRPASPACCRDWSLQLTDSMTSSPALRPNSPQYPAAGAGAAAVASACTTPESRLQQQQQLQQSFPRAARQMFLQLPLRGHASMSRQDLQLLGMGLQWALLEAGAPLSIQLPDYAEEDQQQLACWSAHDQVGAELHVYDTLLGELCSQSRAECSQKGTLLLTAVSRYQQLLHEALTACDTQHNSIQEAAARALQREESIQGLMLQLEHTQQRNLQLMDDLAAMQQELESVKIDLNQHKDKMRKGRYHLISEQVQEAHIELQKRMLEQWGVQLQAARSEWATEEMASRARWQAAVLQLLAKAVGQEVADALQQELPSLDTIWDAAMDSAQHSLKLASETWAMAAAADPPEEQLL